MASREGNAPAIDLVRWGIAIRLVEKFAYREIDQRGPALEGSVTACRHNDQLSTRQIAEYFGILFDRCEVVVASHDEHRYRDLLEVGGFDHHGLKPHVVALRQ